MAKFVKGKPFTKGKKRVMYIYKNGKKGAKKLVSVKHKLARGHTYVTLAKLGYAIGRGRRR
jgi:cytoplasmic iron level regulating protein YaaA (DUF328/UPF0246 family)